MLNQYTVSMYYSTPKSGPGAPAPAEVPRNAQDNWSRTDWICNKCGVHNFRRRDFCFKCNISKEESERAKEGDGFDQVGTNPCNRMSSIPPLSIQCDIGNSDKTLIFRGLDALTTEENLVAAVNQVTTMPVKNIKIIRDDLTGTSRSFAFAEMTSIQDSTELLEAIQNLKHPFEVDGKAIMVSYAKNTFTTTMATMNQTQFAVAQTAAATWDFTQGAYDYTQTAYYDQTTGQYYDPLTGQYYDPATYDYAAYYGTEFQAAAAAQAAANGQQDTTNAAAAVAQAAIQQAQAAKQYQKQHETMQKQIVAQMQHQQKLADMTPEQRLVHEAQEWSSTPITGSPTVTAAPTVAQPAPVVAAATEYPKYPVPDVSSYQYDEASGYYYDPLTSLYYDASSQYYYNSTTGQFMYWDGEQQTYLPAPTETPEGGEGQTPDGKKGPPKDKKEKVKVAKKIAKDMEKWAKTLNAQKEAMKEGFKKSFQPLGNDNKESASADAGFAILEKRTALTDRKPALDFSKKEESTKTLMPPPPLAKPGKSNETSPGLVASYGGDSDDDEDDEGMDASDETKLVDLSKMACLLCKRQFPNRDALNRHTQLSDLHRKNLDELRKKQAATGISIQYRDRAKERRAKYGIPTPPVPKKRAAQFEIPEPYEQPTKEGIGHENIGNKLLQKMGWSKGQGLGKANQGIVDPIQALHRQQQAGLGARGSNYQVNPGESYKETVKKVMYARYQELQ